VRLVTERGAAAEAAPSSTELLPAWWRDGRRPPHFADLPGEIKAREALTTMALLARSELCVRTDSALSAWAMTLPGQRRTVLVRPVGA